MRALWASTAYCLALALAGWPGYASAEEDDPAPPPPDFVQEAPAPKRAAVPPPIPVPLPAPATAVASDKPAVPPKTGAVPSASANPVVNAPPKRSDRFIEGELANVGAMGLVPWQNRVGAVLGVERIGDQYFGALTPEFNWSSTLADRPITMSLGVPIRLELYDSRPDKAWSRLGKLRMDDWNEPSDFAQVIRQLQYGGKEEHFYLDVNAFKASTLGHGTQLRRYNPNVNLNTRRVSAQLDGFGDFGGAETFLNDVTAPNVMGALVFFKPLSFIDRKNYLLRSFSLGASAVADLDAPLRNRLDLADVDDDGRRLREYEINQKSFQPVYLSTQVVAYGADAEIKLVDTPAVDWKTYVDASWLVSGLPTDNPDAPGFVHVPTREVRPGGATWGHLLRLNLGEHRRHALRFRAEARLYDGNYLPGYFDVLYEVQRVQYRLDQRWADPNGTKLQQVLGRPADQTVRGGYLEASWKAGDWFAFAVGLEVNDQTPDNHLFVHMEVPRWENLQLLATLHRRNAIQAADLVVWNSTASDLLLVKARYRLAEWLHINAEALTPYGIGPDSFFKHVVDFNMNVELGFSYGRGGAQ